MLFRDVIDSPCGLKFVYQLLELQSGLGRKTLLESEFMTSREAIELEYARVRDFHAAFVRQERKGSVVQLLQNRVAQLKDIGGTLKRLAGDATLDEVELFEIKLLTLLNAEVSTLLAQSDVRSVSLPKLHDALEVLDPEDQRVPSFYVYDVYSEELRELRRKIRNSGEERDVLIAESLRVEETIRAKLSAELRAYADVLVESQRALAQVDILLAKALQIGSLGLCFPDMSNDGRCEYIGMFHPQVKQMVEQRGGKFQPIDIVFGGEPTTIIGANMGGKTVVLRMLSLSQYLFQFGFGVPAQSARVDIKDSVSIYIGDPQSSDDGLSSFAGEVVNIDKVISTARGGGRALALIDEPARSTNPVEGTALVAALVEIMRGRGGDVVITTHYDLRETVSHKLRVTGVESGVMNYKLVETSESNVPHEAIGIAQSLGADREWIERAKEILAKK